MRMHASHPDYLKFAAFLDGEEQHGYWWADDATGEIEVYELANETVDVNGALCRKLVLGKDGHPKRVVLKGTVELVER